MPLFPSPAAYPGASAYPREDGLFPDDPVRYLLVFRTPTVDVPFRIEGRLFGLEPYGLSVWRIDGVWREGLSPSATEAEAADRFYGGGRFHVVTEDEADELADGGYADNITLETE